MRELDFVVNKIVSKLETLTKYDVKNFASYDSVVVCPSSDAIDFTSESTTGLRFDIDCSALNLSVGDSVSILYSCQSSRNMTVGERFVISFESNDTGCYAVTCNAPSSSLSEDKGTSKLACSQFSSSFAYVLSSNQSQYFRVPFKAVITRLT